MHKAGTSRRKNREIPGKQHSCPARKDKMPLAISRGCGRKEKHNFAERESVSVKIGKGMGDEIRQFGKWGRILAGYGGQTKQKKIPRARRWTKELEFFIKEFAEGAFFRTVFWEILRFSFCPHKILDISNFVLQIHS